MRKRTIMRLVIPAMVLSMTLGTLTGCTNQADSEGNQNGITTGDGTNLGDGSFSGSQDDDATNGYGQNGDGQNGVGQKSEEGNANGITDGSTGGSSDGAIGEKDAASAKATMPHVLPSNYYERTYIFNEDGSIAFDCDMQQYPGNYVGVDGMNLFTMEFAYNDTDYWYKLYKINLNTEKTEIIAELPSTATATIYQGNIYVTYTDEEEKAYRDLIFSTVDGVENTQLEKEMTQIYDGMRDYTITSIYSQKIATKEYLDRMGFFIVEKDNVRYRYDGSDFIKIKTPQEYYSVVGYDENAIYYTYWNQEQMREYFCAYTYADNQEIFLSDNYYAFFGCFNQAGYWAEKREEIYGLEKYRVQRFQEKAGKTEDVVETGKKPGDLYFELNPSCFLVEGESAYYLTSEDNQIGWYRIAQMNGTLQEGTKLDLPVKTEEKDSNLDHLEYVSNVVRCEKCQTPLSKCYEEYPVLKESLFASAEACRKANDALREMKQKDQSNMQSNVDTDLDDSACEYHYGEGSNLYTETYQENYDGSCLIGDSYLSIGFLGYWYGGGAHGMDFMEYVLVDLKTGDLKKINDFYTGSEEDFADLVAKDMVETVNITEAWDSLYAENSKDLYREAYDNTSFESIIEFTPMGIVVYYSPYVLGPYAAGYFSTELYWEDLGFDLRE